MRRIYVVVGVVVAAICFGLGFWYGSPRGQISATAQFKIDSLRSRNKALAQDYGMAQYVINRYQDTVKEKDANILSILRSEVITQVQIKQLRQDLALAESKVLGQNISKLDSMRWAWYPDSVTAQKYIKH